MQNFIDKNSKKKVHRGTLHEMIKNETNKCAKQPIETKAAVTPAPAAVSATDASITKRQQHSNDIDNNRHVTQYTSMQQRTLNKYTDQEVDDDECNQKPLSKSDLIRKFDTKYKHSDSVDNKPAHRTSYDENQAFQCTNNDSDELENDENIQNSNSEETAHDFEYRNQFSESESITIANNNYTNPNANMNACSGGGGGGGGANANGNESIPPKPLPRTSRNNSMTSLSSEHSLTIVANTIEDSIGRPVAKPRTTTTSYKVHSSTHTHIQTKNKLINFYILFCTVHTHIHTPINTHSSIYVFLSFSLLICFCFFFFIPCSVLFCVPFQSELGLLCHLIFILSLS